MSMPPGQFLYLPLLATAMALMMVRFLFMARLLDVGAFGVYSAGLLISTTFCMLAALGLQLVLQRDMPVMAARGRLRRPLVLLAQSLVVATLCAAVLLVLPLAGIGLASLPPAVFAIALVHGLSQQVFLIATVESRSVGEPVRYALQNLARAGAVVLASATAAHVSGSPALALATEALVSIAITVLILHRMGALRFLGLAWRRLASISWETAAVFLGVSLAASAIQSLDRWFGAGWLAAEDFAQYAFAGIVVLVAQSGQAIVNASVYPAIARRYAAAGRHAAFALSARASMSLLAAGAVLAFPAGWGTVWAVQNLYPAYAPALSILWLVLAVAVLRLSDFWSSFLMVCGHERQLLAMQVAVGAVIVVAWFAAVGPGGIASFAWLALLLSTALYAACAIAAIRHSGAKT